MKFLFINKPFSIEPLGIMYLSSVIKEHGHNSELILTSENLEERVLEYSPDFVAYSIMTGDHKFYDDINKKLRERFFFRSIIGGPHPTFFPEFFEDSSFDTLCVGEGETPLKHLLSNPENKNIPNLWFKTKRGMVKNSVCNLIDDLDTITFPDRELVFKYKDIREGPIKHFLASRGCPFNCTYCFNHSYSDIYKSKGNRVRFRSVDNLLKEVKEVVSSYPSKFIYFQDDIFILRPKWLKEFSKKYKEQIGLPFHCHTRANLVTKEIADDLAYAGCYSVHIAAESGNEYVRRDILNRKMTSQQIIEATHLFNKFGIKTMLQNMLGLPFTTLENDFETLELNIKAQPDYAWASIFQPYPKTALGEKAKKEGVYSGDFSDIGEGFFDQSLLNLKHKNEVANLQKLFAIAVKYPQLYYSGCLNRLIHLPYEETRDRFTKIYKGFRKRADRILYGIDI